MQVRIEKRRRPLAVSPGILRYITPPDASDRVLANPAGSIPPSKLGIENNPRHKALGYFLW